MTTKDKKLLLLELLNSLLNAIKAFVGSAQSDVGAIVRDRIEFEKSLQRLIGDIPRDSNFSIPNISGDANQGAFQWGHSHTESIQEIKSKQFMQALCLIYQVWEEVYRESLVGLLGKQIYLDIFGDIRLLRNAYFHGYFKENPSKAVNDLSKLVRLRSIGNWESLGKKINESEFFAITYALNLTVVEIGIDEGIDIEKLETIPSFLKGAPENLKYFQNDDEALDKIHHAGWYENYFKDELLEYENSVLNKIENFHL